MGTILMAMEKSMLHSVAPKFVTDSDTCFPLGNCFNSLDLSSSSCSVNWCISERFVLNIDIDSRVDKDRNVDGLAIYSR